MTNELTVYLPKTIEDGIKYANIISKSQLAPAGMDTPEKIFIAMQLGASLGLDPLQSVQGISVIKGKPNMSIDLQAAIIRASGQLEYLEQGIIGEGDDRKAVIKIKRKNEKESIYEFSVKDAKAAKLWGKQGPWTDFPDRMLIARPKGFAFRDIFPDVLKGITYNTEEMRDVTMSNVNPIKEEVAQIIQEASHLEHIQETVKEETFDLDYRSYKPQDFYDRIVSRILEITDEHTFEDYKIWKANNQKEITRFCKDRPEETEYIIQLLSKQTRNKDNEND